MISLLRGKIAEKSLGNVIVDVGGVGYGVTVSLSTFYKLSEPGTEIELKIHTHLKDSSLELFGFLTEDEKRLFQSLIGIAGIGPKGATNILSNISPEELIDSIISGDLVRKKVPGIGPKTATRLINELKDKLVSIKPVESGTQPKAIIDDVISALMNLGYTKAEIDENHSNLKEISSQTNDIGIALRDSLKIMKRI